MAQSQNFPPEYSTEAASSLRWNSDQSWSEQQLGFVPKEQRLTKFRRVFLQHSLRH
jgi:hypothetical protein